MASKNGKLARAAYPFRFFSTLRIKDKLIVALIPILLLTYLVFACCIFLSFQETKTLVDRQASIVANQKIQLVDSYLQQLRTESEVFMFDLVLQKKFSVEKSALSLAEQDLLVTDIRQLMYGMIINYDQYVESIAMMNRHGDAYYWRMDSRIAHTVLQNRLLALSEETRTLSGGILYSYDRLDEGIITMSRAVRDITFDGEIGILMIDFNLNFLHNVTSLQTSSLGSTEVQLAVANQAGTVIYNASPLSFEQLEAGGDARENLVLDGTQYKINRTESERNDWTLYTVVNETELYHTLYQNAKVQILLMLLSVLLVLLVIYRISSSISGDFRRFMQQVSRTTAPDKQALIPVTGSVEFRDLAGVYNEMILRINRLIDTVYAKELLLKSAELKAFQAQINPHFLYNTLDCINGLVELNRPDDIKKTVTALASLMRMSIKGREMLTVRENIRYIDQYMFIEKLRYADKLIYLCDIPEHMMGFYMPKLILQPILENAIIHGISELLGRGMIGLFGREDGDDLVFTVKDNGRGFPEPVLRHLEADGDGACDFARESIGLLNIQKRLRLLYGAPYGLTVQNLPAGGAAVTVRLPKITEDPLPEGAESKP